MKILETWKNWYRNTILALVFNVEEALDTVHGEAPEPDPYLTLDEAALLLKIAPATFIAYRSGGKLVIDGVRVDGRLCYPRDQVLAAVAARRGDAP